MSNQIGEVNINLRLSLAQFKQDVKQGTAEASRSTKQMADEMRAQSHKAKDSLDLLSGSIGVTIPRELKKFIAALPAISSGLSAAFSAVAVVALAEVVIKSIEKIKEMAKEIGGFGKEAQEAYAKFIEGNKQALKFAEDLRKKYLELSLIGLSGAARDVQQAKIDTLDRLFVQEKLNAGLAREKEIEQQIAAIDVSKGMSAEVAAVSFLGDKLGVTEDKVPGLRKELAELATQNQMLAQSLKSVGLDAQTHDLQANADAAKRAADAQNKLAEILFRVYQERTKIHTLDIDNSKIPNSLTQEDAFSLRPQRSAPSFTDTFGPALMKQNEALLKDAQQVYESTRNSAERYADELAHLTDLLGQGVISQETFNRGVQQSKDKYDDATIASQQLGASILGAIQSGQLFGSSWQSALQTVGMEMLQLILRMTLLKNLSGGISGGFSFSGLLSGLFGGGKATGGPVDAGKYYEWQESGREYFSPKSNGYVIPESKMGSGGGGQVVHNNIEMHLHGVTDADSFRKSQSQIAAEMGANISRHMRRNG